MMIEGYFIIWTTMLDPVTVKFLPLTWLCRNGDSVTRMFLEKMTKNQPNMDTNSSGLILFCIEDLTKS
jgi:hypothetical protein